MRKIDGTSPQLREAIEGGARIIVTTIQKFSTTLLEVISGQRERNFAIIVDEAHSSRSGKSAQAVTETLTREAGSSVDVEDLILAYQRSRGPQQNMSFFAFTATPRNVTLERFGEPGPGGKPTPFHLYAMRQAIEEGFILDVLQHYMTYTRTTSWKRPWRTIRSWAAGGVSGKWPATRRSIRRPLSKKRRLSSSVFETM